MSNLGSPFSRAIGNQAATSGMKNPWSRKGLFYRAWQTTQLYRDDNKNEFFASLTNVGILGMSSGGLCFHCSNGFGVRWETCLWAKTFWISQSCNAGQVNSEREMRTIQSELLIHILSNLWMASPSADARRTRGNNLNWIRIIWKKSESNSDYLEIIRIQFRLFGNNPNPIQIIWK